MLYLYGSKSKTAKFSTHHPTLAREKNKKISSRHIPIFHQRSARLSKWQKNPLSTIKMKTTWTLSYLCTVDKWQQRSLTYCTTEFSLKVAKRLKWSFGRDLLPPCLHLCRTKTKKRNILSNISLWWTCKFVTDYRTFMKDFLKVVDFVHYLRAEGYDMVTFDKVGNGIK